MMNKIYTYEEIFQEIPDDPDNIMMTIPPEILTKSGWVAGDTLNIKVENGCLILTKVTKEDN